MKSKIGGAGVLTALLSLAQPGAAQDSSITLFGATVPGDDVSRFEVGVGAFNFIPDIDPAEGTPNDGASFEGRIEFRYGRKLFHIGPMAGVLANSKGGVFGYGALYMELEYGDWVVSPSAGAGGYHRGNGKTLGGVFQFILSLDVAYELSSGNRFGVKLSHISNAFIHDNNPGEESVLVTFSIPLKHD